MTRFYYERRDSDPAHSFSIYDRARSNTNPLATCSDETWTEMICNALNRYWETPDEPATTASPSASRAE